MITSLALPQSQVSPRASEVTLKDMGISIVNWLQQISMEWTVYRCLEVLSTKKENTGYLECNIYSQGHDHKRRGHLILITSHIAGSLHPFSVYICMFSSCIYLPRGMFSEVLVDRRYATHRRDSNWNLGYPNVSILLAVVRYYTVMIRVNCVRFNMTAADAQVAQLGIGCLWAWYDLGLNVWVGLGTCRAGCWNVTQCFDLFLTVFYESHCAVWTHEC